MIGGLTINDLKMKSGVNDAQLDTEIMLLDTLYIAQLFENPIIFVDSLGLRPAEQSDIMTGIHQRGIQAAMYQALRIWIENNPYTATYRKLVRIALSIHQGRVALDLCKYIANK